MRGREEEEEEEADVVAVEEEVEWTFETVVEADAERFGNAMTRCEAAGAADDCTVDGGGADIVARQTKEKKKSGRRS